VENRVEVAAHLGNMGAVAAAEGAEQVDAHGYKAVLSGWVDVFNFFALFRKKSPKTFLRAFF